MKTCPSCGTKTDSKFCPECGTDLSAVPNVNVCPKCGTESTAKFCPECGTSLTASSPSEDSANFPSEIATSTSELIPDAVVPIRPQITPEATQSGMGADTSHPTADAGAAQPTSGEVQPGADETQSVERIIPVNNYSTQGEKKPKKPIKKILIIVGGILLLLIVIGAIAGGGDEDTSSTSSTETESYYEEEETTEPTTTEPTTTEPTTEAPKEEFTSEDDYDSVSYDDLARKPDDYEGDLIKGSGNVVQVIDGESEVDLRVATSDDGYDDVVYLYYDPSIVDSRILEDDQVTYYGRSMGLYTYESTMGGEITIPCIRVHKITR